MMEKRMAYVCSPYKGEIEKNILKAKEISIQAFNQGYLPLCVHAMLEATTGLNEQYDRPFIIQTCLEYLKKCDTIIVNTDEETTQGMNAELKLAEKLGLQFKKYKRGKIE